MEDLIIRVRLEGAKAAQYDADKTAVAVDRVGIASERAGKRASESLLAAHKHIGAMGAVVGLTGIAFGIKDLVKEGLALEEHQKQLRAALRDTGITGEAAYKKIEAEAIKSAEHGGFLRDTEIESITKFIGVTHSANAALEANKAAVLLARREHLEYSSVQRYIGQALVGNVRRLQQYTGAIIPVRDNVWALMQAHKAEVAQLENTASGMKKTGSAWLRQQELLHTIAPAQLKNAQLADRQATAHEVLQRVLTKFPSAIDAYNSSTEGKLNNLKTTLDVVTAEIGQGLLPAVNKVLGVFGQVITWMNKNRDVAYALAGAITFLSVVVLLGKFVGAIKGALVALKLIEGEQKQVTLQMYLMSAAAGVWSAAMVAAEDAVLTVAIGMGIGVDAALGLIGLALVAVGVGLFLLITHFKQVKDWLASHWPIIAGILIAPMTFGLSIIVGIFYKKIPAAVSWGVKAIRSILSTLGGIIKSVFSAIYDTLSAPFRLFITFLTTIWSKLGSVLSGPFKILVSILKTVWSWISKIFGPIQKVVGWIKELFGGGPSSSQLSSAARARGVSTGRPVAVGSYTSPGSASGFGGTSVSGAQALNSALSQGVGGAAIHALESQHGQDAITLNVHPQAVVVKLDSKTIAQGIVHHTLKKAARGPSSLVGGALVTGAAGPAGG